MVHNGIEYGLMQAYAEGFDILKGKSSAKLPEDERFDLNLTDMETCYKCFRREVIQSINIEEDRFGFEPEITAKLSKMRLRIYEVGISYSGRTYDEGKKIGWRDGVRAVYCIVRYSKVGDKLGPLLKR
jgi:hypothetical protein